MATLGQGGLFELNESDGAGFSVTSLPRNDKQQHVIPSALPEESDELRLENQISRSLHSLEMTI